MTLVVVPVISVVLEGPRGGGLLLLARSHMIWPPAERLNPATKPSNSSHPPVVFFNARVHTLPLLSPGPSPMDEGPHQPSSGSSFRA